MDDASLGIRLLLIALLLGVNAFFAGAEVALLSSRRLRLKARAAAGNVGAQAAVSLLENPERLLSVTQVGVTLTSLGLGWAGESTFHHVGMQALAPLGKWAAQAVLDAVAFGFAFLAMGYLHVIIGEVVPKNLAFAQTERLAVLTAPPLLVFYRVSLPFVYAIEHSAAALSRVLGLRTTHSPAGHTVEDLRQAVASSRTAGQLPEFEESAIQRILDLSEFVAREAMVPRNAVVAIPIDADLDHALRVINKHRRSRYPVYRETPENIVGLVLVKDLMRVWEAARRAAAHQRMAPPFDLSYYARKPIIVPETKPLDELMRDFRDKRAHMAIVVDEFGTMAGIITLEDVLEQVFGEIADEYDTAQAAVQAEAAVMDLDGALNIHDLEARYGIALPDDEGFETLAGFALYRLGVVPEGGESFLYEGRRYTVTRMEHNRIAALRVERQT